MKTYEDGLFEALAAARTLLDPDRRQLVGTDAFHAGADWALRSLVDVLLRKANTAASQPANDGWTLATLYHHGESNGHA